MLHVEGPVLHIRRVPVRLDSAQSLRSCGSGKARHRIVQPGSGAGANSLLIWRIGPDVLLVRPYQHLLMIYTVAGANRGCAFPEGVPGQTDARREIFLWYV